MASYEDYSKCIASQAVTDSLYTDKIKSALRNYACWYYAFTIRKIKFFVFTLNLVYFLILYKPFNMLYKLSGILMTLLILAGYGICIANIIFTGQSKCTLTTMGKVSVANMVVFVVIASLMLVFSHSVICIPLCKKSSGAPTQVAPGENDQQPLTNQQTKANINETNIALNNQADNKTVDGIE